MADISLIYSNESINLLSSPAIPDEMIAFAEFFDFNPSHVVCKNQCDNELPQASSSKFIDQNERLQSLSCALSQQTDQLSKNASNTRSILETEVNKYLVRNYFSIDIYSKIF